MLINYPVLPANIYMLKVNNRNRKEGEKFVQTKKKDNRNDIIPASIASFPANISLFQVDKISTRKRC